MASGTSVTGTAPSEPANAAQAHRPAATPSGSPAATARPRISPVCQVTTRHSCPLVMPSALSRASSWRRRRTELSTVSPIDSTAAAASPVARASGRPPSWAALCTDEETAVGTS